MNFFLKYFHHICTDLKKSFILPFLDVTNISSYTLKLLYVVPKFYIFENCFKKYKLIFTKMHISLSHAINSYQICVFYFQKDTFMLGRWQLLRLNRWNINPVFTDQLSITICYFEKMVKYFCFKLNASC